jgi:hypothetical protein
MSRNEGTLSNQGKINCKVGKNCNISSTFDFENHGQAKKSKILLEI